jgi:hypothetical protein
MPIERNGTQAYTAAGGDKGQAREGQGNDDPHRVASAAAAFSHHLIVSHGASEVVEAFGSQPQGRAARLGFSAELGSRRSGQGVASLGDTTIEDGDKSSRFFQGAADRHEILHTAVVDDLAKRRWGGDDDEGAIVIAKAWTRTLSPSLSMPVAPSRSTTTGRAPLDRWSRALPKAGAASAARFPTTQTTAAPEALLTVIFRSTGAQHY